jgi:DNA polymerase elongation subunit (family B)
MLLYIYEWQLSENLKNAKNQPYQFIKAFGISATGKTYYLKLYDFPCYFYLKDEGMVKDIRPLKIKVLEKHNLYGYEKEVWIQCFFKTETLRFFAKHNLVKKYGETTFEQNSAEVTVSSMVQMLTASDYKTVAWYEGVEDEEENEFYWNEGRGKFVNQKTGMDLTLRLDVLDLPKPVVFYYDCEVYFDGYTIPKTETGRIQDRVEDCLFQISTITVEADGSTDTAIFSIYKVDAALSKADKAFSFETEEELLRYFALYRNSKRPNFIIGYNNYGFDLFILHKRMARHNLLSYWLDGGFSNDLGKVYEKRDVKILFDPNKVEVPLYVYRDGVVELDLNAFVVKQKFDMPNRKLSTLAEKFLQHERKLDFSPMQIFKSFENKDVQECATYCVQDTLVLKQCAEKTGFLLDVFQMAQTFNISMDKVYGAGEQLKTFPTLHKQAQFFGIVFTSPPANVKKTQKFKGAIVLEPITGLYVEDGVSLDFNSLYPSCMQSSNICPSTYVSPANAHRYHPNDLHIIEFNFHEGCDHDPVIVRVKAIEYESWGAK